MASPNHKLGAAYECILKSAQLSTFFLITVAYNIDLNANYMTQRIYQIQSIVSEIRQTWFLRQA
jgi:hypothetical protein